MGRKGWVLCSAAAAMVGLVTLYVGDRPAPPRTAPVAVVSAPVVVQRPAAATPAIPVSESVTPRQRPERRLVEAIATHDRRGGDVRTMATTMVTQPHPATAMPIETTMTEAISRLPLFTASVDPVHVTCVRTTCEVAGLLPPGQTQASMTTAFRDKDFERTLLGHGYTPGPVLVADVGDGRTGFVFYINNEF